MSTSGSDGSVYYVLREYVLVPASTVFSVKKEIPFSLKISKKTKIKTIY